MTDNNAKLRYLLYARRSSEAEDKQVASIEDQVVTMKKLAKHEGIKIVDTLSESMSAKKPGRPVFDELLQRIANDEADGIICWN